MQITLLALDEVFAVDIGLRIISSLLKANGHKVNLLFNTVYAPRPYFKTTTFNPAVDNFKNIDYAAEAALNFLKDRKTDLLGISVSTNHFERASCVTKKIKEAGLKVFIVWGGVHPTVRPQECLDYADCVCIGEGERPMLKLVNCLSSGQNIYSIPNLWFKKEQAIIKNEVNSLAQNIDELPFQDYDLTSHYLIREDLGLKPINESILQQLLPRYTLKTQGSYALMATRGCPYSCGYCINNFTNQLYGNHTDGKIVRRRSVASIISELTSIKEKFPSINSVFFMDDLFVFGEDSGEWLGIFSREYKEKIGLPFMCSMHFNQISGRVMDLLISAGLKQLSVGIESGGLETSRNLYQRYFTPDNILKKTEIINRYKQYVVPSYDIILDNPYEADDELRRSLELVLKIPEPFRLGLYSLTFFPGTPLYEKAKADGVITDELTQVYRKHYNDIDKGKYLNRIFLIYPYLPRGLAFYLIQRRSAIRVFLVFVLFRIFELRNLFARSYFYQWLKKLFSKPS